MSRPKQTYVEGSPRLPVMPAGFPEATFFGYRAAQQLCRFISLGRQRAPVIIHGDYDADGTTAAAVMWLTLRAAGVDDLMPFISKRDDGYGINHKSIARMKKELGLPVEEILPYRHCLIWLDHGVNSYVEAKQLLEEGFDILCLDHHEPDRDAPGRWDELIQNYGEERVVIYDPLLYRGLSYEEEHLWGTLSAAGVAYSVLYHALTFALPETLGIFTPVVDVQTGKQRRIKIHPEDRHGYTPDIILNSILKLVAISVAADVMTFAKQLTGSQFTLTPAWLLAKEFEKLTSKDVIPGVAALTARTGTASRVGWSVGPIINAPGRNNNAQEAFNLMLCSDEEEAKERVARIDSEDRTTVRKNRELAKALIPEMQATQNGVVVFCDPSVPKGVVGLAAADGAELFGRPCAFFTEEKDENGNPNGILTGSMRRGDTDFSCEQWILKLKERGVILGGGGHPAAAGLKLSKDKWPALVASAESERFNSTTPPIHLMSMSQLREYIKALGGLLPLGKGHEIPKLQVQAIVTQVKFFKSQFEGYSDFFNFMIRGPDEADGRDLRVLVPCDELTREEDSYVRGLLSTKGLLRESIRIQLVVEDRRKADDDGKWPRLSFKVACLPGSNCETPSGRKACIAFAAEGPGGASFDVPASVTAPTNTEPKSEGIANIATPPAAASELSVPPALQHQESFVDSPFADQEIYASRISMEIDWVEHGENGAALADNLFILHRPSSAQVKALYSENLADVLRKRHGGEWASNFGGYIISHAAVRVLMQDVKDSACFFDIRISASAAARLSVLDLKEKKFTEEKMDTRPFQIPYWKGHHKTPKDYQYADARLLYRQKVSLCGNEMGTGKTLVACLWAACAIAGGRFDDDSGQFVTTGSIAGNVVTNKSKSTSHNAPERGKALMVTKVAIVGQYADEAADVLDLRVAILTSDVIASKRKANDPQARQFILDTIDSADIVVMNYDCVEGQAWILHHYKWAGVVLDEAHELKNPLAGRTKAILGETIEALHFKETKLLAMSGTFAANRPGDWFVWVKLTNADNGLYTRGSVKAAQTKFETRFDGLRWEERFTFDKKLKRAVRRMLPVKAAAENGEELKQMLSLFFVRRLKTEAGEMPEMTTSVRIVPSCGLYFAVASDLFAQAEVEFRKTKKSKTAQALIQAAAPHRSEELEKWLGLIEKRNIVLFADNVSDEENSKKSASKTDDDESSFAHKLSRRLAQISSLDKAHSITKTLGDMGWLDGNPFVVFVQHRSASAEIADQLRAAGIDTITLTQADNAKTRALKIAAFQNEGKGTAFVTSYGVGAEGLTLTRAHRVVLAGLPWREKDVQQSRSRVHRIGQTQNVEVAILILGGSLDHLTWDMLKSKGTANFKTLSYDQLRPRDIKTWEGSLLESVVMDNKSKTSKSPKRGGSSRGTNDERDLLDSPSLLSFTALKPASGA